MAAVRDRLVILVVGGTLSAAFLFTTGTYPTTVDGGITAVFQFVSAITCTGFSTATDMGRVCPPSAVLLLTVAMIIGGRGIDR